MNLMLKDPLEMTPKERREFIVRTLLYGLRQLAAKKPGKPDGASEKPLIPSRNEGNS